MQPAFPDVASDQAERKLALHCGHGPAATHGPKISMDTLNWWEVFNMHLHIITQTVRALI
ncbi:hypothetical protein FRC08_008364 [Ceratobasidium sp. 394]|nr:hypothetical protein FRC08_008364 [Ceratobasidium sp. 394]